MLWPNIDYDDFNIAKDAIKRYYIYKELGILAAQPLRLLAKYGSYCMHWGKGAWLNNCDTTVVVLCFAYELRNDDDEVISTLLFKLVSIHRRDGNGWHIRVYTQSSRTSDTETHSKRICLVLFSIYCVWTFYCIRKLDGHIGASLILCGRVGMCFG